MPETWYAVYETSSGRLVSVGTILGDSMPPQFSILTIGPDRPADNQMWDETTRQFVARPADVLIDLTEVIMSQPELSGISPAVEDRIRIACNRVLGNQGIRFQ